MEPLKETKQKQEYHDKACDFAQRQIGIWHVAVLLKDITFHLNEIRFYKSSSSAKIIFNKSRASIYKHTIL